MSALQALYYSMVGEAAACAPQFTAPSVFESDFCIFPCVATAGIEIDADGWIETFIQAGNQGDRLQWDGGCGTLNRADYDFRADQTSLGPPLSLIYDPESTWIPGTSLIAFGVSESFGDHYWQGTLRVRPAGGGPDIDTCILTLLANAEP